MTTKLILNESIPILDSIQANLSVNNEGIDLKFQKFNVMQSSEISKVLRELTQCVANEHDLLVPRSQNIILDGKCTHNNVIESVPKNEISCSEVSGSTTTNCSIDLVHERRDNQSHICEDCGKHFLKKDFLQKHRIVHEEPRHRCGVCEKSFVREDKLKRHFVSIHSKQRPHICSICAKAFARKDKLKDHQKHHLTVNNNFLCFDCHIPFVQKSDLNRHTRNAHKTDDCGHTVPKGFSQSNNVAENQVVSAVSAVPIQTTFLPLLTVHPQAVLPLAVVGNPTQMKPRKARPRRSTRPPRILEVSMGTDTAGSNTTSTAVPSPSATSISNHTHYAPMATTICPCSYPSSAAAPVTPSQPYTSAPPSFHSYYPPLDPVLSSVFSFASPALHGHPSHSNQPRLATDNLLFTHNHQDSSHHSYYPPYLHHRPPITPAPHSTSSRPLTTNIYPYLPF